MAVKIFTDTDYIELLLLNFDIYGLDELNYFDLKECTQLVLDEIGYIPDIQNESQESDSKKVIKIIADFTEDRTRKLYRSNCFNYKHHDTGDFLKCRFIEPPLLYKDGKLILFRSKDLQDKRFFSGLNFHNVEKGDNPVLVPPSFAYSFFHEMHNNKEIEFIDDVLSLCSTRYANYIGNLELKEGN